MGRRLDSDRNQDEKTMYARLISFSGADPEKRESAIQTINETVIPMLRTYDGYVYGWNTRTGRLVARIRVGGQPHGLLVWPQPGRYSLGHTGILR